MLVIVIGEIGLKNIVFIRQINIKFKTFNNKYKSRQQSKSSPVNIIVK